jgi:hypothetical protein
VSLLDTRVLAPVVRTIDGAPVVIAWRMRRLADVVRDLHGAERAAWLRLGRRVAAKNATAARRPRPTRATGDAAVIDAARAYRAKHGAQDRSQRAMAAAVSQKLGRPVATVRAVLRRLKIR